MTNKGWCKWFKVRKEESGSGEVTSGAFVFIVLRTASGIGGHLNLLSRNFLYCVSI